MTVELTPTRDDERENFIINIQASFRQSVADIFGSNEEVIPREDVIKSFDTVGAQVLNIIREGEIVGGAVVVINSNNHNELLLFFVKVEHIGKGIGNAAWRAIEHRYPDTKVWTTLTPYLDKRNVHFYINKCGFHAVEFLNPHHPDPEHGDEEFFRFEKVVKP